MPTLKDFIESFKDYMQRDPDQYELIELKRQLNEALDLEEDDLPSDPYAHGYHNC